MGDFQRQQQVTEKEILGQTKTIGNDLLARLEAMPFEEARRKILHNELGSQLGSYNHELCLSWLREQEETRRDRRESSTLFWARHAAYAAYIAAIIAATSIIIAILK